MEFEEKIRMYMRSERMYKPGDRILVGISGGKDSLVLGKVMAYVKEKDDVDVEFLHINFGQQGSDLLEKMVERYADNLDINLHIYRLEEEWGLTFPELAEKSKKNPCSLCSLLLRYYTLYLAWKKGFNVLATGHNLDDIASFYLYNLFTGNTTFSSTLRPVLDTVVGVRKVKPFFFMPEEKIAEASRRYNLTPVPTGCPSEDEAPTVKLRSLLKEWERSIPGIRKNIVRYFLKRLEPPEHPNRCKRCGMPSGGEMCAVCRLKDRVLKISS